ncbi:hypothetical protein HanXRQr2_Chr10g0432951 [Helianthus annuus]|uniref:Uncharacterized protein n=1 Tax=Helianthus annuus TaxID=4232 RepID=A0A251TJ56_HELAN|nr:hypothetical protein HanXRQr2_Chr10g0432951 [Helianthus annuus]KAJ0513309.1 hypothetical protein HanHA300_Chr10g0356111 [Helianthus annuus]KAJ0521105.1 hypothetical protein HanIR_Chr10g0467021 [Helianthus annuus]KAJ0529423.1 hypothetical protein HanHA89_Chr10g0377701 [Helianthus annuus]KAJ0696308.1 hypothetical protein HanLR1_Chr10g0355591 [Helianthus annuus]
MPLQILTLDLDPMVMVAGTVTRLRMMVLKLVGSRTLYRLSRAPSGSGYRNMLELVFKWVKNLQVEICWS